MALVVVVAAAVVMVVVAVVPTSVQTIKIHSLLAKEMTKLLHGSFHCCCCF